VKGLQEGEGSRETRRDFGEGVVGPGASGIKGKISWCEGDLQGGVGGNFVGGGGGFISSHPDEGGCIVQASSA